MIPAYWLLVYRLKADQNAETPKDLEIESPTAIESAKALPQKEGAQLARLLEADPIDRNAIFSLINRLIQARAK